MIGIVTSLVFSRKVAPRLQVQRSPALAASGARVRRLAPISSSLYVSPPSDRCDARPLTFAAHSASRNFALNN